jgi:hypothetical protein
MQSELNQLVETNLKLCTYHDQKHWTAMIKQLWPNHLEHPAQLRALSEHKPPVQRSR